MNVFGDRLLIKPTDRKRQTAGGILLPDSAKQDTTSGTVIAIGPGTYDPEGPGFLPVCPFDNPKKNGVAVGDTVHFSAYAGNRVKVSDVDHLIIRADEVLFKD
jgi:chaperonin GroES